MSRRGGFEDAAEQLRHVFGRQRRRPSDPSVLRRLDGWGAGRWGARGLAGSECVVGGLGAALLLSYFLLRKKQGSVSEVIGPS